jgi:ATPase subunit of ABC transporter with duplicated ATPase domains
VAQLATRILEITPAGLRDFAGTYDEYLERLGDDHLDAEAVLLRARREKRREKELQAQRAGQSDAERQKLQRKLAAQRDRLTAEIEKAEGRIHAINELFCDPTFFDRTARPQVQRLEAEQKQLSAKVEELMAEWEKAESELAALEA